MGGECVAAVVVRRCLGGRDCGRELWGGVVYVSVLVFLMVCHLGNQLCDKNYTHIELIFTSALAGVYRGASLKGHP